MIIFWALPKNQELSSTLSVIGGEAIIVDIEAPPRGADRAYDVKPPQHSCDWSYRDSCDWIYRGREVTTGLRPRSRTFVSSCHKAT